MGDPSIYSKVSAQFGPNALSYVTSPTHSDEASLRELVELVQPLATDRLLDVATGAGHCGLAFAPKVAHVVLYDLTPSMLEAAADLAQEKGIHNFSVRQGVAEELPYEEGSFDIVAVRTAPHHFSNIEAFVSESYRVLKPGGKFLMVDTTVPEDSTLADEINRIETLRDPSHVRNLRPSEWRSVIESAGFRIVFFREGLHANGKKLQASLWMNRIGTPEANRAEIIDFFSHPTPALREALKIELDGDEIGFTLPELVAIGHKPE